MPISSDSGRFEAIPKLRFATKVLCHLYLDFWRPKLQSALQVLTVERSIDFVDGVV